MTVIGPGLDKSEHDVLSLAFGAIIGACMASGTSVLRMRELLAELVKQDEVWSLAESVAPGIRRSLEDVAQGAVEDIEIAKGLMISPLDVPS
jgi:predicted acylesterase/phospholipase RssA